MNWKSIMQAGIAVMLYYAFWGVVQPIIQDFTAGGSFWAPLNALMVSVIPFVIFLGIAVGGVRDDRSRA